MRKTSCKDEKEFTGREAQLKNINTKKKGTLLQLGDSFFLCCGKRRTTSSYPLAHRFHRNHSQFWSPGKEARTQSTLTSGK